MEHQKSCAPSWSATAFYYAAVEQTIFETGKHEVFALICLVAYDPRDREGYIFGYNDMTVMPRAA